MALRSLAVPKNQRRKYWRSPAAWTEERAYSIDLAANVDAIWDLGQARA